MPQERVASQRDHDPLLGASPLDMVLQECSQELSQVRSADFFEVVAHATVGVRKLDEARQIDGRCDDDGVAGNGGDRISQLSELRGRVSHGGERLLNPRIAAESLS